MQIMLIKCFLSFWDTQGKNLVNIKKPNGIELNLGLEKYKQDLNLSSQMNKNKFIVSCFGGGNINDDEILKSAKIFASSIAVLGATVISGGGSGIMEMVDTGASEVSLENSLGLMVKSIEDIRKDQKLNHTQTYETLAIRMLTLLSYCDVAVFFPGGYGTFEEVFSLLVRIKVGMMKKIPIYFICSSFWTGLKNWLDEVVCKIGAIQKEDVEMIKIVDNIDDVINEIKVSMGRMVA